MKPRKHLVTFCLSLLFVSIPASAQQWQSYQLTHFTPPGQVRQCGSVADSLGNIHHYLTCLLSALQDNALFYMRTDFYGHILTDTVRLNGFAGQRGEPSDICVVGDGQHSWCTFAEYTQGYGSPRGFYLTGRDGQGEEILPPTLMNYPVSYVQHGDGTAAALRMRDSTIHWVGVIPPSYRFGYCRFTTQAETLIWGRQVDGLEGVEENPSIVLSPVDGRGWAAMRSGWSTVGTYILVVRFGEDTSQTVYHPFEGSTVVWGVGANCFGMDRHGNFDFVVGNDTTGNNAAYTRLDSTFQVVRDWQLLSSVFWAFGTLKTDSAGNCLCIWNENPGLRWAYRRADGAWLPPSTTITPTMRASSFSVVVMDSSRVAFTCQAHPQIESFLQLRLYTYGFPPDAVPEPKVSTTRAARITVYPNPFTSMLQLDLPVGHGQVVVLYDLLGREVWRRAVPDGEHSLSVNDPHLAQLPSGTYYLTLRGKVLPSGSGGAPRRGGITITHVK